MSAAGGSSSTGRGGDGPFGGLRLAVGDDGRVGVTYATATACDAQPPALSLDALMDDDDNDDDGDDGQGPVEATAKPTVEMGGGNAAAAGGNVAGGGSKAAEGGSNASSNRPSEAFSDGASAERRPSVSVGASLKAVITASSLARRLRKSITTRPDRVVTTLQARWTAGTA